jgi:hypothetical protein
MSAALYFLDPKGLPFSMDFGPLLAIGLFMAMFTFAMLLPFLILSSASPFYRERLKALLHVKSEAPPVMAPVPEASLKT